MWLPYRGNGVDKHSRNEDKKEAIETAWFIFTFLFCLFISMALKECTKIEISKERPARDMSVICVPCSQRETLNCVPSLCVKKGESFCCLR